MFKNFKIQPLEYLKHCISDVLVERKLITELVDIDRKLEHDGCAVIENYLTMEDCDELIKKAIHIKKTRPERINLESNNSDMRIYGVDNLDDLFKLTKSSAKLNEWAKKFYKTKTIEYFQMLGHIVYKDNNKGSGSGWHRDSPFSHQFKFILYLNDVNEGNGPFQYIKGTHKTEKIRNYCKAANKKLSQYRFTDDEVEEILKKSESNEVVTVIGKAGTLLVADVKGIHRGKPLEHGERWATTRYYFKGNVPDNFRKLTK